MNCHEYQDAILDFVRHELDEEGVRSLRSHLERCAGCAYRVREQQVLAERLNALAAATMGEMPPSVLETRLLERFVAEHSVGPVTNTDARPVVVASKWLKIAAALALATAALVWWSLLGVSRSGLPPEVAISAPQPAAPSPAPQRVETVTTSAPEPALKAPSRARRPARVVHPDGFVPLPASDGLPAFESGQIVRMEIPLTSLPNYGVQISPEAVDKPVQADLLVGQDGQPRAIRLVTRELQDSRSRQ
jgi:hypothetical protein